MSDRCALPELIVIGEVLFIADRVRGYVDFISHGH